MNATEEEIDEYIELTLKAMTEIRELHPKKGGKWPSAKGTIMCPKCGSSIHYIIASTNGHIWGKCETEKCLCWMM